MQKIKRFTFKKADRSGRYGSFQNEYHEIKVKGKRVGDISRKNSSCNAISSGKFGVTLYKKDGNNITFKKQCATAEEAKEWLNSQGMIEYINENIELKLT